MIDDTTEAGVWCQMQDWYPDHLDAWSRRWEPPVGLATILSSQDFAELPGSSLALGGWWLQ